MRIEHGKVADNDRNRKSDSKNTREGAESTDEHPGKSFRCHIAIAYGGHCDQGPPQASRYAVKTVVGIFLKMTNHGRIEILHFSFLPNSIFLSLRFSDMFSKHHSPLKSQIFFTPFNIYTVSVRLHAIRIKKSISNRVPQYFFKTENCAFRRFVKVLAELR